MGENLTELFTFIGIATIVAAFLLLLGVLWHWICDTVDNLKWKRKYKHRFDKSPTAACYCKDCVHFSSDDYNICFQHRGWVVSDAWFCWAAEPRKSDPDKK